MNEPLSIEELFKLRDANKEKLQTNRSKLKERQREILQAYLVDGESMINIGKKYGITRARVHQIISKGK